jgi:hypothetical protein
MNLREGPIITMSPLMATVREPFTRLEADALFRYVTYGFGIRPPPFKGEIVVPSRLLRILEGS